MEKWFKNLNFNNSKVDIKVEGGFIKKIEPHDKKREGNDYKEALVLPPFNDPHIHIDSVLTMGKPYYNKSGSLFEGINIWRKHKQNLNKNDFIKRTNELFKMYIKNGIQNIRAHIDITNTNLEIIKWTIEQKEKWKQKLNIQIAAFPQDGVLSVVDGKKQMETAIVYGVDVLGGIPHYEFSSKLGYKSIEYILDLAKEKNLLVDMHCDEIDDGNSKFLEHLATETWLRKMQNKVTASHTTAFAHYNNAYVYKLWRILKISKINFIANPLVNVHLGGRFESKNKGRGITRVKEIIDNKINIAFGHDDIQDPWYSLGNANMLQVLFMGIHLSHLMGINEIENSINLITNNSAKIMQLKNYGIKIGHPANFIILEANSIYDAIRMIANVKENIRFGKKIN